MRGKVKNVRWEQVLRESSSDHWRSDVHPGYKSYVLADLYDSPQMYVDITKDVLDYYGGSRITPGRVDEIRSLLHNVWVDFYHDENEDTYYLDGSLSDYITP